MSKGNERAKGHQRTIPLDVAVIGGGPAGVSACITLSKFPKLRIALFESEEEPGGIPRTSHLLFFGFRDLKRICTGKTYARKLERAIRKTSVEINTGTTVLKIIPGANQGPHRLEVLSPKGVSFYESRFILLTTGCFESSRPSRIIPGTRPAGVLTTGTLLELVNLHRAAPGKRALILGSEHVALEAILTLRRGGTSIVGLVEEDAEVHTYPMILRSMSALFRFPVFKETMIKAILGDKRVTGVELVTKGDRTFRVDCDTVIITGKFRAYSPLLEDSAINQDPATFGPVVDMNLMTSVPNIFAAGNILRGSEMHDLCALEGRVAARHILRRLESGKPEREETITLAGEYPVRYVVPQRIAPARIRPDGLSCLSLGYTAQVAHTLKNPVLEAWSNDERIWEKSFSRLIGNTRIVIPVHKFDWGRVDKKKGVVLRVASKDS